MSNTVTATTPTRPSAGGRFLSLLIATGAAVAVWLVARLALDIDLKAKPGGEVQEVGLAAVVVASLVVGLLAWGLVALLNRITSAARTVWIVLASLLFVLSLLVGPASGEGTSAKVVLAVMHLVVALVLVPAFARTARKG